jgi:hypothetical protein
MVCQRVAGVIVAPSSEIRTDLTQLFKRGIPVVALDRKLADRSVDSVRSDNVGGAYASTSHLLGSGRGRPVLDRHRTHLRAWPFGRGRRKRRSFHPARLSPRTRARALTVPLQPQPSPFGRKRGSWRQEVDNRWQREAINSASTRSSSSVVGPSANAGRRLRCAPRLASISSRSPCSIQGPSTLG